MVLGSYIVMMVFMKGNFYQIKDKEKESMFILQGKMKVLFMMDYGKMIRNMEIIKY
jgi:hypothetical protein